MKTKKLFIITFLGVLSPFIANAADSTTVGSFSLVPSFENIAVYSNFSGDDNANNQATLEYREAGGSWKPGIAMTVDRRDTLVQYGSGSIANTYKNQWRAVIFWLNPNTTYEVRVTYSDADGVSGSNPVISAITTKNDNPSSNGNIYYVSTAGNNNNDGLTQSTAFRTVQKAADVVVAGDKVLIMPGTYNEQVRVNRSGAENNYITFQSFDTNNKAKIVTGSGLRGTFQLAGTDYIRIKDLDLTNPDYSGVQIAGDARGNIIEDNIMVSSSGGWWAGGVVLTGNGYSSGPLNTIIQRNQISTTVIGGDGPFGVLLYLTGGGTVIRNNSFIGGFYDGIGGAPNFGVGGGPYKDSYIYNNYFEGTSDDGIEVEGGGINCAVWGNTVKNSSTMSLGIAPVIVGPMYVFRNVFSVAGDASFKMGSDSYGFIYFYHNTLFGSHNGVATYGSNAVVSNATFRNNIIQVSGGNQYDVEEYGIGQMNFDYDSMYSPRSTSIKWLSSQMTWANWRTNYAQESHGIWGQVAFNNSAGGDYTLQSGASAIDKGQVLVGFNDSNSPWPYQGLAPDMGAYEYSGGGAPPVVDTTPPVILSGQPSGTLSAGTTQTTVSITTNESAACKYGNNAGTGYSLLPGTFSTTGGMAHSFTATGLTNGGSYNYYVRCQDAAGNPNTNDFPISFSIASSQPQSCTDLALGTPVVAPVSPQQNQMFTIACPANNTGLDCVNAYADANACVFSNWSGNRASFNCSGLAQGIYTARCSSVDTTSMHCCVSEKTVSFTVVPTGAITPPPASVPAPTYSEVTGGSGNTGGTGANTGAGTNQAGSGTNNTASISELQQRITQILAQIASLQSQIAQTQGALSIPSTFRFTQPLYFGMNSTQVRYLQTFLKNQGKDIYPEQKVTGYYYTATYQAVLRFQLKYGIVASSASSGAGRMGPKTMAKINELMGK